MTTIQELFTPHFFFGVFTTAIVLVAGHYFPLPKRDLHPLVRYSCGTAIILLGVGVWLGAGLKLWWLYGGLWIMAVVGGIAVTLCYGYDAMMNRGAVHYALTKALQPSSGRGGPRTPADAFRLKAEDIIGYLKIADEHLRVALLRIVQWATTSEEKEIVDEILEARRCMVGAQAAVLEFHQDRREQ